METNRTQVYYELFNVSECGGIFRTLNGHCVFPQDLAINIALCFAGTFIVLTNIWVCFILFARRAKDEDTSLTVISNLAMADTFTGFMVVYDTAYNILQFKVYVECILRIGMFIFFNLASVFIIMLLTFERLIKISKSFTYRKYITIKRARVSLVVVWTVSLAVGLLPFFGWSSMNILYLCSFLKTMSESFILFVLMLHIVPFLCTFCAYIRMAIVVHRHASAIKEIRRAGRSRRRSLSSIRAAMSTFIIVGVYFLCWAPIGLFTVLVILFKIEVDLSGYWSEDVVFTYLFAFSIANSALNPLIYASKLDIIRKKFRVSLVYRFLRLCCQPSARQV